MPDRREVKIPWDLSDRQAALEAKKKFCAEIDAAGRSPSPCAEILRDEFLNAKPDKVHHYLSEVADAEVEQRPESRKIRHSSRTPIIERSHEAEHHGTGDINMDEDNDDDLYGLTPEAIVEDSMDVDEVYENTQRPSHPIETSPVTLKRSAPLQNLTATERTIGEASKRTTATKEIIDVSDDSSSSSGSDPEYEKRAATPVHPQIIQKTFPNEDQSISRAPRSSSKASSGSRTGHLSEVTYMAETLKRITTSHGNFQPDFVQNVEQVTRPDVNPVVRELLKASNEIEHALRLISLPDTPLPPATPLVPWSRFPSTSGVKYQTPFPRGTDASIVPNTIRQPLQTASTGKSTPLMKSKVFRGDLSGHIKSSLSNYALSGKIAHKPPIGDSEEVTIAGSRPRGSEVAQVRQASSHKSTIDPTGSMRRTKSDPVSSSTSGKMATYNMFPKGSNGIRKEPKGVRMVKEPQRIFKDLGFFFFPDNDVNQQRFMRIRKAMEYGAKFIHPWTGGEGVSHIIVDSEMQYEDVLKHVKVEELPEHIAVVNQRYPSDCISNQILVDPNQKLYDVVRRRPRANSAKMRQIPQEERTLVQETPAGKGKEGALQKSAVLKTFPKAAIDTTQTGSEAVKETPIRRFTAPAVQKAAMPPLQKETRAEPEKLLEDPNITRAQQIQSQINTLRGEISKQRSNIDNAKIAVARSNEEWTEEMGIDDPDLINGLKITVKDRLQRYKKEMAKLETQLDDLEKQLAELRKGPQGAAMVLDDGERSSTESAAFSYNDSFNDIIQAAKAVAHLPVDSDSEEENNAIGGDCDDDSDKSDDERPAKRPKVAGNSAFQCMEKHDGSSPESNPNAQTIEILEQMSRYYEGLGDQWRPRAYRMAIKTLKKEPRKIISKDDAVRLSFVGTRLAAKIEEIATTNRLRKLDNAKSDPVDKAIEVFRGIYGVGLSQATKWVNEGYRTLEDLCVNKIKLTDNQRIGVEHYDDLQTRIPRAEVAEHGRIVKEALTQLGPAFEATIMGSYRRGASNSGDIDIIITKPGVDIQHIRHTVVGKLIPKLLKQDFLKFGLATGDENSGSKWHGCSCLPTSKVWRRIDFLFVPYDEMGAALIYFTGNDIFNRSMRLLASKKGMRLNQRGLYRNVMRGKQRQKITEGELMEGKDEKRIFEILGVPYRPPEHRIC